MAKKIIFNILFKNHVFLENTLCLIYNHGVTKSLNGKGLLSRMEFATIQQKIQISVLPTAALALLSILLPHQTRYRILISLA